MAIKQVKGSAKVTSSSISPKVAPKVAKPIGMNLEQRNKQVILKLSRKA